MLVYFPQWHGSGEKDDIFHGAENLYNTLENKEEFVQVEDFNKSGGKFENNIQNYQQILYNLTQYRKLLTKKQPKTIFTLGGDCGLEVIPISYLNNVYENEMTILWFDAHGDLNTPESSPSKTYHGMPVRLLLGEGDEGIGKLRFSEVNPKNIVYIGLRDLDPPEASYISNNSITVFSSKDLKKDTVRSIEQILSHSKKKIYIHLDLDILDPSVLPHTNVPTDDGIDNELLLRIIEMIHEKRELVGASVLEYTGNSREEIEMISKYIELLTKDIQV